MLHPKSRGCTPTDEESVESDRQVDLHRTRALSRCQSDGLAGSHDILLEAIRRRLSSQSQNRRPHYSRGVSDYRTEELLSSWTSSNDLHVPGRGLYLAGAGRRSTHPLDRFRQPVLFGHDRVRLNPERCQKITLTTHIPGGRIPCGSPSPNLYRHAFIRLHLGQRCRQAHLLRTCLPTAEGDDKK